MASLNELIAQYGRDYKSPITAGIEGYLTGKNIQRQKMLDELEARMAPYKERKTKAEAELMEQTSEFFGPSKLHDMKLEEAKVAIDRFKAENPDWKMDTSGPTVRMVHPQSLEVKDLGVPVEHAPTTQVLIKEADKGFIEEINADYKKTIQHGARLAEIDHLIGMLENGQLDQLSAVAPYQVAVSSVFHAFGLDPTEYMGKAGIKNVEDYETFNALVEQFPLDQIKDPDLTLTPVSDADLQLVRNLGASIDKTKEADLFLLKLAKSNKTAEKLLYPFIDELKINPTNETARRQYFQVKRAVTNAPKIHRTKEGNVYYFDQYMKKAAEAYYEATKKKLDLNSLDGILMVTAAWNKVVEGKE